MNTSLINLNEVLNRLRKDFKLRQCGVNRWDACCPAHDDRNRSMRVYHDEDGKLRFVCFAGCDYRAIRAALGIGGQATAPMRPMEAHEPKQVRYNFPQLARMFASQCLDLTPLADELGLSVQSLTRLGAGRMSEYPMFVRAANGERRVTAWTFPMANAGAVETGLRLRFDDGQKGSFTDSTAGLFLPDKWSFIGPAIVVEGPTDTAAVLDWGFDAVGKPSCNDGDELVEALLGVFVKSQGKRDVVILANRDEAKKRPHDGTMFYPGQDGAHRLAAAIVRHCKSLKVILPPHGIKDARAWLRAGGTRRDLLSVIAAARHWRRL